MEANEGAQATANDVAIIGMSGRFPGASDVDALWSRVVAGDDCLVDLDAEDLIREGLPADLVRSPTYVKRAGILADVAGFDRAFFGIGSRDAAIMDPQHRHFLECAWTALESSGTVPEQFEGAIGVFGGCGMDTYLINNLLTNPTVLPQLGWFLLRHTGNDKDFFTNNVSYRLDLHGPAINVQTACSTSLVAVHLATQSLLSFECDLALAGGATIGFPHEQGYEYQDGEILSPDGRCRAFDVESAGTVITNGVGVVALRRLDDALAAGDPVLAVIKGTAINNDGARKVGFLAPSVDGHADIVREALTVAGLSARDIQLLEAHGTGTAVGDPIEVAALTEAFRTWTADTAFCRLVSTKPNIGHLDTAAGVASLIKVVQAMGHRTLPPLANHTAPSPLLDLERSPFVLSGEPAPWPNTSKRRAGISSLGVGGTNAHVIVEEAPALEPTEPSRPEQVVMLSARSEDALRAACTNLADHLEQHPDDNLADVAHTLVVGRRAMANRLAVTATDTANAIHLLRTSDRHRRHVGSCEPDVDVRLGFMFPGGGSQYPSMGFALDDRFEVFHQVRRQGMALVRELGGPDLEPLLDPSGDATALRRPTASLPAVCITSIALAQQWMRFGARPDFLLGHSLGEYVAAHFAGVLSFEDVISLVVTRSRLMERVGGEGTGMMAVPLSESALVELLPGSLSLATINAPEECVIAGRADELQGFTRILEDREATGTLIPLAAAAHSSLLDPVLPEFLDAVRRVRLGTPTVPYPSNLTGNWITEAQATDPQYWVDHLRGTVRFSDCVTTVGGQGTCVLSELGPGQALSSYVRRAGLESVTAIPVLRHPDHEISDTAFSLHAYARQWLAGVPVRLDSLCGESRRRLRLPTYPFQHERCWIEPGRVHVTADEPAAGTAVAAAASPLPRRIEDLDRACWIPAWESAPPPDRSLPVGSWLVIADEDSELVGELIDELRRRGGTTTLVTSNSDLPEEATFDSLSGVLMVAPPSAPPGDFERSMSRWLVDAPAVVTRLARSARRGELVAITRGALAVNGLAIRPTDALALGVVTVAPREYPGLRTRMVDADPSGSRIDRLVDDIVGGGDRVVAHRGDLRLAQSRVRAEVHSTGGGATGFRDHGTYLLTGGLGGVGHVLARHLTTAYHANLVIVTSEAIPASAERDRWLNDHALDDPTSRRIRQLRALEDLGAAITVVQADVSDERSLREALDRVTHEVGPIDGAIHAAGRIRDQLLEFATTADYEYVVGPKARAAIVLADELQRRGADLLVLISSTSTLLAPEGQTGYVAANAVLDEMAGQRGALRIATMNFGVWAEVGIASEAARRARLGIEVGELVEHPILSELHRSNDGTVRLVGRLDARHQWIVDEHRTLDGQAVLPGTGHLELMLTGARLAGRSGVELKSVALLRPLVVADDAPTMVRVTVTGDEAGSVRVESDTGRGRGWIVHSEGAIASLTESDAQEQIDLGRSASAVAIDLLEGPRRNLQLGPHWDAVDEAWAVDDTAIARLALQDRFASEAALWTAHPALLDVATGAGVALGTSVDERALYVPVGYGRVRIPDRLAPAMTVRARRDPNTPHGFLRVDLVGVADGQPVLHIDGLDLLPVLDPGHLHEVDEDDMPEHRVVAPSVVELADQLGLRPDEGVAMLERLVNSEYPRLIGSTIDLDDLLHRVVSEPEVSPPSTAASTTSSTLEGALQAMWRDLLGLESVSTDDDFFDVGGHSLIAIRLMSRIQRELDTRLQLATIFEDSTIAKLAARIREATPEIDAELAAHHDVAAAPQTQPPVRSAGARTMPRHLIPITTTGHKRPLYIVHGAGGSVLFLWNMARKMAGDRPVYALQAHGMDGTDGPDPSIEAMAARYVAELHEHGRGPYLLGGYSAGGLIALEMVNQLRALGEQVDYVVLFDSTPGGKSFPTGWQRRSQLAKYIVRGGIKPVWPYLRYAIGNRLGRRLPSLAVGRPAEVAQDQDELEFMGNVDEVFWHVSARAEEYEAGVFDVDAVLLKAEHNWPGLPEDYYWRPHIGRHLDVRVVPGEHHSMFYPENVGRLAEIVREVLDERDVRMAVGTTV